ncbi:MAG: outer membrane protein transport protein [Bacteroidales bacterium]|nr:outer membrane protein transport protein [Bacteroidales bacterium]
MLLKKLSFSISIFLLIQTSIAQNEIDALRFSETDWHGSARFMGAGRAFSAVGAEFSALNLNPASIGLYKKSEVSFTPMTISAYKNISCYNGTEISTQTPRFNLSSVGIVLALPGISSSLWKKFQIGFGYNRINNYNTVFSIEGRNAGSTIGSAYAKKAEGLDIRDINDISIWNDEMYYAYEYWLISPETGKFTEYEGTYRGKDFRHSSTVKRAGGNDEMVFSFGTNYDDKLFLGVTLGIPIFNFTENRTFEEVNDNGKTSYNFQYITFEDKLNVRSTGINLKLGVIYQPANFLRVGFAFHTPTYYGNVKDYLEREINYRKWEKDTLNNLEYFKNRVKYVNNFNYSLTTPLRAMVNMAFFIAKQAFISAEYEITDYSMANMYSVDYSFREENKTVQQMYGVCHTARIGAEMNVSPVFAIRAGYNYTSSPFKNKINDGSKHYASTGFGFRTKHFYGDFAYAFAISKEKYWMYDAQFVNAVNNQFLTHRIIMSLGVRF